MRAPFRLQPNKRPDYVIGIYLILISSVTYGFKSTISKIVFDNGSDPFSLLFLSSALYCIISVLGFRQQGIDYKIPKNLHIPALILGLLFTGFCIFYAASVIYIPVSISTLVFFTFPFFVGAHAHLIMKDPLPTKRVFAFIFALAGLGLVFHSTLGSYQIETIGLVFAGAGALLKAACIIFARKVFKDQGIPTPSLVIVFYMCLTMTIITGLVTLARGLYFPETPEGFEAIGYAILFFIIGIPTFYLSIRFMGPVRVAFFNFLEPLISILSAYFLLAERLNEFQILGAMMMLIGLTLMPVRRSTYYFKDKSEEVDKT